MNRQKGFTLIELLIVVAIIGIIAAIAIPSLLRARVSANEAAAIGDTRTVISAEAAYQSAASGFYGEITCLATPSACITNYAGSAPTFADSTIGAGSSVIKQGYVRSFYGQAATQGSTGLTGALDVYCYASTPTVPNKTGVRAFGGDTSGVVGQTNSSTDCCGGAATLNTATCAALK